MISKVSTGTPEVVRVSFGSATEYAYRWAGGPVEIGDKVVTPSSDWAGPRIATVVGFGRNGYDGWLATVSQKHQ